MKKCRYIGWMLFGIAISAASQPGFRAIAPRQPVAIGEPFEIQYIIEGNLSVEEFTSPVFRDFHVVSGPYVYKGSVFQSHLEVPLVNTVYTLMPVRPGKYFIPGAKAIVNGTMVKSNDIWLQVITKEEALRLRKRKGTSLNDESEYFLEPGEDPLEKISRNLFLKVQVDRTTCYVGEPVVATFKLYSRLQSKSDIVKNPGFYGFAVYDMVNLDDKKKATEAINGKNFDVHTIRQVQLFPLQAGNFTIDPMEISNAVEFSKSRVDKKTEQEIVEGIAGGDVSSQKDSNTEVYKNNLRSAPIPITVSALPLKDKPDSFNNAVGNFSITSTLAKNELLKNEEGTVSVEIKGKGNFTELSPPAIQWPEGLEGFEPVVKDSLDKSAVPLTGSRIFKYGFISAKPGIYSIPPLIFSFFDSQKKQYKKLTTASLPVQISYREKENTQVHEKVNSTLSQTDLFYWWVGGGAAIFIFCTWLVINLKQKGKKTEKHEPVGIAMENQPKSIQIDAILQPVRIMMHADDKSFYNELNKSIRIYFTRALNISGSVIHRTGLIELLREKRIDEVIINDLASILDQCEMGIYADALIEGDKQQMLDKTKVCLKAINEKINSTYRKKSRS